jgi:iron complex transport system ATP-binding protein
MITLSDITIGYGSRTLLESASATFVCGEFAALLGRNGAGKSTLLRTIAGLARPKKGEILLDGHPMATLGRHEIARLVAVVSTERVRVQNLKVADAIALGRAPHTNWLGHLTTEDRLCVERAIALTGLADFVDKSIDTLSDGERQRVMIARALAQQTPVILLDEPTAYLDLPARYEIFDLLRRLARDEGKTILCSTHDLDVAAHSCSTLAIIHGGHLLLGPAREMFSEVEEILRPQVL